MSSSSAYRGVVLLLWALAAYSSVACRGLFWDGTSFLVSIIESGTFHDFYPARAHIDWVTQAPLLAAIKLGVRDARLLAMIQSAALFALPVALYSLALARVRADGVLLAIVMAIVAMIYLPTSFFIIGEYNAAYAAATAAMAVVLTFDGRSWRDGALLCALGALCIASYEATIYLGPLLAAAILWVVGRAGTDRCIRLLGAVAALAFLASAVVAGATFVEYWNQTHFVQVRAAVLDFWQNLQFIIPLAGFAVFAVLSLVRPSWLGGRGPSVVIGIVALLLAATPWFRRLNPESMLSPPAQYVARTAAGGLLAALLVGMWVYVAWRREPPVLLANLRQPAVGRKMVGAMFAMVLAAAVPDLTLTRLWTGYLDYFRGLVVGHSGLVSAGGLPMRIWPQRLFSQDWTYPALSAILRSEPGQAIVVIDKDYRSNPPFEPSCGTVPRLRGYAWRD
ncbi:MAG: hypothetical protein ACHQK9_06515 [Reyranellales bacterium]